MAWDEWEELKAAAAQKQSARTEINHLADNNAGGPGRNGGDLVVNQACAHIPNPLDYSKKLHSNDDARIVADLQFKDGSALPVPRLNDLFK